MLSKNTEALKSMNSQTGKFAKWYVNVLDPKVIDYSFHSRGEKIQAQKFQCVLVSHAPEQYMLGFVPFDFKDRSAAVKAAAKFTANSVWEITTPAFDTRAKPEFNGCPVKSVVLLSKPTTTTRVLPTSTAELAYPAKGVHVALDIKGIVDLLKSTAGSTPERKSFDFCGKFLGMGVSRSAVKAGVSREVADAEFTDAGGGRIVVSVWQAARDYFSGVSTGAGVAVLGCSAALENGEVKINVWPGAHVCTSGEQAQSLTSLDTTGASAEVLTATFTPGRSLAALVDAAAHPTCAAALADAVVKSDAITFQINRCILEVPLQQEAMYTEDGRLFLKSCRLRDGTGGVDVDVVSSAAPVLYGCADEAGVRAALDAQSLTGVKERLNVRGILRAEGSATKRYIVEVAIAPLEANVSMAGARVCRGLSEVVGDVVLPVPVGRVLEDPLAGLAVRRDDGKVIGANRVLLLVRGTTSTHMEPIQEGKDMAEQTFKVSSTAADCLLSDQPAKVNLVGYCDFNKMLTYRLDTESALILASAVDCPAPGSASAAGEANPTATIESVTKLSKDEVGALTRNLAVEWKAVLTTVAQDSSGVIGTPDAHSLQKSSKSPDSEYWSEGRQPKVRRLLSEPCSPIASSAALAELRASP